MVRPSKPISLVKGHRTKTEKEVRSKAEKDLLTGSSLRESDKVKTNMIAHKEFSRLKKLLKKIGQADDLYGGTINTYCLLKAEAAEFEEMKIKLFDQLSELSEARNSGEIDFLTLIQERDKIQNKILACDTKLMAKRKMMLDIEKENIMTIQSALRSIPKKPQEEADDDPMAALLNRRAGGP